MFGALLVLCGFVLLVFVLPMWLVTRRGRHVVGPVVDAVNYEQPYPGLEMFVSRKALGDSGHHTRKSW